MAAVTQSGYPVITSYGDPRIKKLVVSGVNIAPGVLKGDVHTIFEWVAQQFNDTVSRLVSGQCWGFAKRNIRGGSGWSNHAGATAIDLNSLKFSQGTKRMSQAQINACRAIVKASGGVIRWGGSYTWPTKTDQMHFEINNGMANSAALKNLASMIRGGSTMTALNGDKRITLTDYRGRFTDGNSPGVTMSIEDFIGNTWEFVKYSAGRLDQLHDDVSKLTAEVKKLKSSSGGGSAEGTYAGTLKLTK